MGFVTQLERVGYAPGSISNYMKVIRGWANFNGQMIVRRIKISNQNATPTLDDEKVPTPQQVSDIRSAASLRGRICVGAVAYAGLRLEALGHQHLRARVWHVGLWVLLAGQVLPGEYVAGLEADLLQYASGLTMTSLTVMLSNSSFSFAGLEEVFNVNWIGG